jgi:cytidylate kinase
MARQLAKELNYVFVDSGAMYRAIALYFLRNHIDWNNKELVAGALANIELEFVYNAETGKSDMYLNGENVEAVIRERQVSENVSNAAAIKEVREFAVAQQQKMGEKKGLIMDGRDIGTTVFPHAELKIFMTADNEIRAERRYKELVEKDPTVTMAEVRKNLEMRDHIDSTREISPLRKADDAVVLDNSHLAPDEQLALAMQWANERMQ